MVADWLGTSPTRAALVAGSAVAYLFIIILAVRVVGLRSFSKMSSFDFAVTVAIGSLLATVTISDASLTDGAIAVAFLLGTQWTIAQLRQHTRLLKRIENQPVLLMEGPRFLDENLHHTRVTRADVLAKLRESNVTDRAQVLAVVLEATGDVSVLHGDGPLDPRLLEGVRGPTAGGVAAASASGDREDGAG